MPTDNKPSSLPTSVSELQTALTESLEPPADAVPRNPDTPSAAPVVAEPASVALPPDTTPAGRIVRSVQTGAVGYSHADVEAVKDRLTPDEYQQLHIAAAQHDHLRAEEAKLVAAVPAWKDTAKGRAEIAKLADFLRTEYHVTDEQIANAFLDSRAIILARDAMRARERDQQQPRAGRKAGRQAGGHVYGTAPGERLRGTPSTSAAILALFQ